MVKKLLLVLLVLIACMPVGAYTKTRLENGLTLITETRGGSSVVSLQLFVKVGSNNETFTERGISHVIEHMVFKGTPRRQNIAKEIQSVGGDVNAFTNYNMTSFYVTAPKENAVSALDVLTDMIFNPLFDAKELTKEEDVICSEINMREDNPGSQVNEMLFSSLYPTYNIGNRIIGTKESVKSFTRENLIDYYNAFYVPNNMVLVIAGDIDEPKISQAVEAFTKKARIAPVRVFCSEIPVKATAPGFVTASGNIEQVYFSLGFRTPDFMSYDTAVLDVISSLLGSGASSRLNKVLRENKQLVQEISCGIFSANYPGAFIISGSTSTQNILLATKAILDQLMILRESPISQLELEKIVAQVRSVSFFEQEQANALTNQIGFYELMQDVSLKSEYEARLKSVTPQQLQDIARKYFDPKNISMAVYYPEKSIAPMGQPDFDAIMQGNQSSLNAKVPVSVVLQMEPREFFLENGVKIILKEDHSLPVVAFGAYKRSSFFSEVTGNNGISYLALNTALKGTSQKDYSQIADIMDQNALALSPVIDKNVSGFAGACLSEKIPLLFNLFTEMLTSAQFAPGEVLKEKALQLNGIKTRVEDVLGYCQYKADKVLYANLPYRYPLIGETDSVEQLTANEVREWFYKCYAPATLVYVFSGDVTEAELRRLMAPVIAKLKPVVPEPVFAKQESAPGVKYKEKIMLDKEQTVVLLKYCGPKVGSKDFYTMKVVNSVLSGMGSRLFDRLREKEHLAYSTGAFLTSGDPYGAFGLYALVPPGNESKAVGLIHEELARLVTQNVEATELNKAKMSIRGSYMSQMQQRADQVESLGRFDVLGMGYLEVANYLEQIDRVTSEDLKAAVKKYFTPNYVQIIVGK